MRPVQKVRKTNDTVNVSVTNLVPRRKIKCNGEAPCDLCIRGDANCTFDSSYTRGRSHVIPSSLNPQAGVTGSVVHHAPGTGRNATSTEPTATTWDYTAPSSRESPEPSSTDLQGHYVGPASGAAFLLRVQKRLHQVISFSSASTIFTFGDAPLHLPESDPSFCMMLPRHDAQRLIDRYFDFAMPTYRFLHRPTIQEWFNEFYDTMGVMRDVHSAPAKIALLFMVFAHARVYMPEDERPGPDDLR